MNTALMDRVSTLIANAFDINPAEITPETDMNQELGADSLDKVEIAITLEDEFDVDIPDSKAIAIKTVKDAAALVEDDGTKDFRLHRSP